MNEKILAICMPSYREKTDIKSDIQMDFLFMSENYKTMQINNEVQFEFLLDDIDDISCDVKKKKIYYHIDHIKKYLEDNFKSLANKLKLDRFNPDNQYILYQLLASNGFIILINSEFTSLLFVPEKLKNEQKKSLSMLKYMIDPDQKFSCFVSGDEYMLEFVNYNEILDFLEVESYEKRK